MMQDMMESLSFGLHRIDAEILAMIRNQIFFNSFILEIGVPSNGVLWQIFEPKLGTQYFAKNCK